MGAQAARQHTRTHRAHEWNNNDIHGNLTSSTVFICLAHGRDFSFESEGLTILMVTVMRAHWMNWAAAGWCGEGWMCAGTVMAAHKIVAKYSILIRKLADRHISVDIMVFGFIRRLERRALDRYTASPFTLWLGSQWFRKRQSSWTEKEKKEKETGNVAVYAKHNRTSINYELNWSWYRMTWTE